MTPVLETLPPTVAQPASALPAPEAWIRIFAYGLALGLFAGAVFGIGLGFLISPRANDSSTQPSQAQAASVGDTAGNPTAPTTLPDVEVTQTVADLAPYRTMGKADAPVKIVLFEDPQCIYCQKMSTGPLKEIIEEYVKTGKATLSYRHSLFLGPESFAMAAAMDCAGSQGKFWEFHDQVYGNQHSENGGAVTDAVLTEWAKAVGVKDQNTYLTCLKASQQESQPSESIRIDQAASKTLRVTGTPTLFVNGKRLIGFVPMDFIRASIEQQLGQTNGKTVGS